MAGVRWKGSACGPQHQRGHPAGAHCAFRSWDQRQTRQTPEMSTGSPGGAAAAKAPAEAEALGTAGTAVAAGQAGQESLTTAEPNTTRTAWRRRRPGTGCPRPRSLTRANPAAAAAAAAAGGKAGAGPCCSCQSSGGLPTACPRQRRQRATTLRTTRPTLHTKTSPNRSCGGPPAQRVQGRRPRAGWGSGGAAGLPFP